MRRSLAPARAIAAEEKDEPVPAFVDPLLRAGIGLAALGVMIQTAVHLVNAALGGGSYFDANGERNPMAWSQSVAIFAGAFICAIHAAALPERRRTFFALAAILAFLSLDEMLVVHERIAGRVLDALGLPIVWDSVLWPLLYVPLLGALLVLLLGVGLAAPARPARLVFIGLGLLAAAVAAEVLSAPLSTGVSWPHTIEGAFEEGAELSGWIVIATGLTATTLLDSAATESGTSPQPPV